MKDVLQLVREGKSWEAKVVEDCSFEELLYQLKGFQATKGIYFRIDLLHYKQIKNVIQNSPMSILNNTQRLAEDMRDQVLDLGLKYSQTRSLLIRWKKLQYCPESSPSLIFQIKRPYLAS